MTIPVSYATLQTALQEMRERSDTAFTNQLTTFIALAEAKLNRLVRVRPAEVNDTSLTGTASSRFITLPSDFMEPVALWLTSSSQYRLLRPYAAGSMTLSTTNGTPDAWAIDGTTIQLDVPCDSAHTFVFRYRKKLFDLATTSPNFLLTNHPDVYLFACLMEACDWENDNDGLGKYDARFKLAVAELERVESRHKARAVMTVDDAIQPTRTGFDFTTGF